MIDNFSGDGMRILGSYISFRNNTIKNCYDVDENHDDGIQSFTTNGYVVDHNEIIGNTIINTDDSLRPLVGSLQGIGCFDGFYNDWLVINNVINVNHWHGITFLGANNVRIINNTVIDPTPDITPGASWIRIADHKDGSPSSNCVVANNVANKFVIDAIDVNNFVLTDYEEYSSNFIDYSIADFRLLSTSSLIGAASLEYAPETDINGNLRLIDNIADVGAYEYMETSTVQEQSKVDIWVYPNPFSNELFIKSETVETVCVFTMNGVSLGCFLRENLNEQLHYLPVGFLLIQFQDKNGNVLESQIVIKER
jgi:hypothetical protein